MPPAFGGYSKGRIGVRPSRRLTSCGECLLDVRLDVVDVLDAQ